MARKYIAPMPGTAAGRLLPLIHPEGMTKKNTKSYQQSAKTYLGSGEEHQGGPFEDGASGGHLGAPPLVFEVVLSVPRHVGKVHHLAAELAKGFDELGKVVDPFQARQSVGYLADERTDGIK